MLERNGKTYRNLEEQVLKNQQDIQRYIQAGLVLSEFGIKVVGSAETAAELPDAETYQGSYGDAYAVGTSTPYNMYIFTRPLDGEEYPSWLNIGPFPNPGPVGPQGPAGPQGEKGDASRWYVGTTNPAVSENNILGDMYLNTNTGDVFRFQDGYWERSGSIRGPQGIQGIQGPQGIRGPQGIQGPQGERGDVGGFNVRGILPNTSQLPLPSDLDNTTIAFLVGTQAPYDLYIQVGETSEDAMWYNAGPLNVATMVTVNGAFQSTWEANTKLDRVENYSAYTLIYGVNGANVQKTYKLTSNAVPNSIVYRNERGSFAVPASSNSDDAANVGVVIEKVGALRNDLVFDINKKLERVTTSAEYPRLYAISVTGTQLTTKYSESVSNNTIVSRNYKGQINVADPDDPQNAATKAYVDNKTNELNVGNKLDKVTSSGSYGRVYAINANGEQRMYNISGATVPSAIIQRNASGQASVADPTEGAHIATKNYVDLRIPETIAIYTHNVYVSCPSPADQSVKNVKIRILLFGRESAPYTFETLAKKLYGITGSGAYQCVASGVLDYAAAPQTKIIVSISGNEDGTYLSITASSESGDMGAIIESTDNVTIVDTVSVS